MSEQTTTGTLADLKSLVQGTPAAAGTEAAAAPRTRISRERARLISVAGLAGALAGVGVDVLLSVDNDRVSVGIPMLGSTVGLLVGSAATRNMPREEAMGAGSAPSGGGALLNVRDGRLGLGVPAVSPMLAGARARGHDGAGAAMLVPVLSARF